MIDLEENGASEARAQRAPAAPSPCPIHPYSPDSGDIGPLPFLGRSALACFWSISHLIRTTPEGCYFWTVTPINVVPDSWFARMHSNFITKVKNAAARGTQGSTGGTLAKNWGGVKVIEVSPGGHGLHSHLVLRGYMDYHLMDRLAKEAGLGMVFRHPDKATPALSFYLASYLGKDQEPLNGIRRWNCVGTYDGIGKRDIVQTSNRIEKIKAYQRQNIALGKHRYVAYRDALLRVQYEMDSPVDALLPWEKRLDKNQPF